MMKVVQLGCGITGLVCAEHLSRNPSVDEIVLADARTDTAERLAARTRSKKMSVKRVDAAKAGSLRKLLKGADTLVSGIPAELNIGVIREAAKLGIDYVDFSMSMEYSLQFDELDSMFRESGATALTAMGADPGISDMLAVYASTKLDKPETVRVMDGDSGSAEGYDWFTLWSPLEMVEEITTPAAVYRDGRIEYLPPLAEKQMYDFPEPIGTLPVYNTTHEETFLIPRNIKGLRYADFRIAIDDSTTRTANTLRKIGMHGMKPIDVKGVKVRPIDVVVALMPRPVDLIGKVKGYAGIVIEMTGEKDGRRTLVKVWVALSHERAHELAHSNATGYFVGTGGATGAELIIDGEFKRRGLSVPEQLPVAAFIERLRKKDVEVREEVKVL